MDWAYYRVEQTRDSMKSELYPMFLDMCFVADMKIEFKLKEIK